MREEAKIKKVTNVWDKVATNFSKVGPNYWNEFGENLVELSNINKGSKVLDIGMGRGASLFPALKKVSEDGEVIGIDFSEEMVEQTSLDIENQNISNAKVLTMDARNLIFEEESFHNVIGGFCVGVLLYGDDSLNGVMRILKQGGEAGFSIWGEQPDQVWLTEIVNKYIKPAPQNNNEPQKVIKFSTTKDIKNVLEKEGFKNIRVYEETSRVVYKDKDEWWNEMNSNAVRGIFDNIDALGDNLLEEFKKDVYKGLDRFKKEEGYVFSMPVIYAYGCK